MECCLIFGFLAPPALKLFEKVKSKQGFGGIVGRAPEMERLLGIGKTTLYRKLKDYSVAQ
jgi:transcriptional regulator of acetoin/glycerol metabolism